MRSKIYARIFTFTILLFNSINQVSAQEIKTSALKQIQSLIDEKEARTPAQKKMDSQLWYAIKMGRGESITSEVPTLLVDVNKNAAGKVPVDIRSEITNELLNKIKSVGGEVQFISQMYKRVSALVPLQSLEQIAALAEVKVIYPQYPAMHAGAPINAAFKNKSATTEKNNYGAIPFKRIENENTGKYLPGFEQRAKKVKEQIIKSLKKMGYNPDFIGAANSQGDIKHNAATARTTFSVNGAGIKIGILSDSYDTRSNGTNAIDDVLSGDLPGTGNPNGFTTPVTVLTDAPNRSDEGRAMLQIVHDLAPGAQLYFASAFNGQADFAQQILNLRAAGCDIICDDVSYFDEAPFQDGIIAQAVNTVTAAGAIYFSSAGNAGNKNDGTSGVWEGDFVDGGASAAPLPLTGNIHNFGGGVTNNLLTLDGNAVALFWSDPLGGSSNDYDLFVLNAGLTAVVSSGTTVQSGTQDPIELINPSPAAGNRIVILKKTGAAVRAIHLNSLRGRLNINTQGQTHGHGSAAAAFSVAAVQASGGGPFNTGNVVENFSSDGPRRKFYNPNGTLITPGNLLFGTNGGTLFQKPDITAADGVATTLPASSGLNPFFGTSAAAPHAAAITALLKQRNPTLTPAQIRTALTTTAIDIETAGTDRDAGFGIVMALEALQSVTAAAGLNNPTATIVTEGCSPANGVIDPGETVTVSFCISNTVGSAAANVVGTLLATGGVTAPSAPQNYGAMPVGGPAVCRNFTFTNNGTCGGTLTASIQFQDGATNLGTFTYTFNLGIPTVTFTQNFDAVAAPALPASWTTDFTGSGTAFTTSATNAFSAPNAAFGEEKLTTGVTNLNSPTIAITTANAKLSFRNLFNTEATFDGELLEIKIGAGAFQDIIAAGGSFVSGGYNSTFDATTAFPGRSAWTGLSGGTTAVPTYLNTVVNLPASAAGQNVQFRWRVSSDEGTVAAGAPGVKIDNVSITDGATCCVTPLGPTVTINQAAAQVDPTSVSPINFTVVFSAAVTGFATGDVTLSGTAGATTATVTGSGTTYNVAVSGMTASGTVIATVPASVAIDGSSNGNQASTSSDNTVTFNLPTGPSVTINQAAAQVDPTATSPINFTVVFSAPVTGFATGDVILSGTAGATTATVTGSGTTYDVAVSGMTANGTVIATIPAGVAIDGASLGNLPSTSTDNSVTFNGTPSTVTINQAVGQPDPTATSPINFTVVFNEPVTGFATGDVVLSGTAGATIATVAGSGTTYTVAVSGMTATGTVIATIPAGVAVNVGGVGNLASTSTDNTVVFNAGPPTVTINQAPSQADPATASPINFTVIFNEPVTGFATGDVVLSGTAGATIATVSGSGTTYNVAVSGMTAGGTVIATIPAAVAQDIDGADNLASTSTDNTVTFINCVLTCPANITVNSTTGQCGAIVTFTPTTTGGCGTVTATPASGSFFPVGTTTVNVSTSTGFTCSFTVTVNDAQPPVITCPANITVSNAANQCGATVTFAPTAVDNCATINMTQSASTAIVALNSVGCPTGPNSYWRAYQLAATGPVTINTVTFGIEAATATQTLNVRVHTSAGAFPGGVLTQVATQAVTVAPADNNSLKTVTFTTPATVPANAIVVLEINAPNNPNAFFIGSNAAGQTAPSYISAAGCGAPTPVTLASLGFPGMHIILNAAGSVAVPIVSSPASGSFFPVGTTTVTSTATDASGNTATCSFTVRVNDTQAPAIVCPANITVTTAVGVCTAPATYAVTGTDNCPGVVVTRTAGPASGSAFPVGTTTVTHTATDAAGNVSTCSFTVTVLDGQLPVISAQPVNRTVCIGSNTTFTVTATNAVSYQWQQFIGGVWTNVAGATGATLNLNGVTLAMNTNSYRVNVIGLCTTVTSGFASLYVNPLPTITLSASNPPVLLPTQSTSIVATVVPAGGTFAWFKNGAPRVPTVTGNTLSNLTVEDAGTYRAVYTDPNGCVNTSADLVVSAEATDKLYIAPNPNFGQFWVRYYNTASEALTVKVFNAAGSLVYQKTSATTLAYTRIDVSLGNASPGIYLVELRGAGGRLLGSRQIIVGHR